LNSNIYRKRDSILGRIAATLKVSAYFHGGVRPPHEIDGRQLFINEEAIYQLIEKSS